MGLVVLDLQLDLLQLVLQPTLLLHQLQRYFHYHYNHNLCIRARLGILLHLVKTVSISRPECSVASVPRTSALPLSRLPRGCPPGVYHADAADAGDADAGDAGDAADAADAADVLMLRMR